MSIHHAMILLLYLIISLLIAQSPSAAVDKRFQACSTTLYNCGSLRGVGYPFLGDGHPSFCGKFNLNCTDDKKSFIVIGDNTFRVLQINQSNSLMTIVREDLWNHTCPAWFTDVTLANYESFGYGGSVTFIKIFYGCASKVANKNLNVTCPVQGESGVLFQDVHAGFVDGCKISILVPISLTAFSGIQRDVLTLRDAVNQGFDVKYDVHQSSCSACKASGRACGSGSENQFVCFCPDKPQPRVCHSGRNHLLKLILGASATGLGILIACILVWYFRYFEKRKSKEDKRLEVFITQHGSLGPKRFSYSDIKKMTDSFAKKLGQGGYGCVYKGILVDGRSVAVKILNKTTKGNGEDFINEVASISRTSHVNVVTLSGFCLDGGKRALIYDFMENGSLEKLIYRDSPLNAIAHLAWESLFQIAIGIGRGLEYLHRGCNTRILHFDIKPHNILLDEDFCPKISDFGLAKLCTRKDSVLSTMEARGTIGYIAPEVFSRSFGEVSHKSDVYSYGMMVMEMVGGRKNVKAEVNNTTENTTEIYFPHWAYKCVLVDKDLELLLGTLTSKNREIAKKMIIVALWCIQINPSNRPSISKVMDMLEGMSEAMEIPPRPYMCSSSRSAAHSSTTLTIL